jgi:transglutaminase-like putative cysteine protease
LRGVFLLNVGSTRGFTPIDPVSKPVRPKAILGSLPGGEPGTRETLRIMRDLVKASVRSPDQVIRSKALSIVENLPTRNWMGEIRALQEFVRDAIRYVGDPVDIELVQTPEQTLSMGQGDCDDKSTLLAALLHSIGHPARFVAIGFDGPNNGFSHVLVETKIANTRDDARDWMPLETILPDKPAGWYPAGVTNRYILKV